MIAATLTHLPIAAGSAMLAGTGRAASWAFAQFMRAPLAHTSIAAMLGLSALAGSNALYFQRHAHPAPLFAPVAEPVREASRVAAPVSPAARPAKVAAPVQQVMAPSIGSETGIGNAEVFELQRKLEQMQLFDGSVDGYYGPKTAHAIKRFEERLGLPPTGEFTQGILEAVRAAPALSVVEEPAPLAAPDPVGKILSTVSAEPVTQSARRATIEAPLPAPAPLATNVQKAPVTKPVANAQTLTRDLPDTPQQAMDIAVETAGDALDTIVAGVQSVVKTAPVATQPKPQATQLAAAMPKPVVETKVASLPAVEAEAKPEDMMAPFSVTDPVIVAKVQRGLGSLGFLHGPADGVAGEATAKAIRNFEVYFNYKVTGRISPELVDLLVQNGASI